MTDESSVEFQLAASFLSLWEGTTHRRWNQNQEDGAEPSFSLALYVTEQQRHPWGPNRCEVLKVSRCV